MIDYICGIWDAICGRFPYKQLEHLEYLKLNLTKDNNWFESIPVVDEFAKRHAMMACDDYKTLPIEPVKMFRFQLFTKYPETDRRKPRCDAVREAINERGSVSEIIPIAENINVIADSNTVSFTPSSIVQLVSKDEVTPSPQMSRYDGM